LGVKWRDGSGGAAGPEDAYFSDLLAGFLNGTNSVTEAMVTANVDLVVYMSGEGWVICDVWAGTVTPLLTDCYYAVAEALLAMPLLDE
jgi:hypothetical protein